LLKIPSELDLHVLNGWSRSILKSYNSAVWKFLSFKKTSGQKTFLLPATEEDIYDFCFWAGKKNVDTGESGVLLVTLKKYLQGLKAWHVFHNAHYPTISEKIVALLLKPSMKVEVLTTTKELKKPVSIKHIVTLVDDLSQTFSKCDPTLFVAKLQKLTDLALLLQLVQWRTCPSVLCEIEYWTAN
jgi:hypothetical protein